ncbi:hypothetical protein [Pyrococcus abyssi]|uniref:Uncharacterized protein n=1 Tax=Pyrococcus abyssi (strain GE5 / Orsay) TaxID=272844 RepID=Q8J2W6_PYRAB|nr:hypothetical protein [Pyrococcus abyssi]CAD55685.1 Hypothetical protein PAB1407 [Pyrococcus abyssi GE5]CCE70908.1 TPA: hypothetical protein PAB1407 [Pyrococcus abyssi GE5]
MKRQLLYPTVLFLTVMLGTYVVVSVLHQSHSQGYTKVYFESNVFPEIVPNKTYEMAFLIESHEKRQVKYVYTVYLDNFSIMSGEVFLNPNDIKRIAFNFSVSNVSYSTHLLNEKKSTILVDNPAALVRAPWTYGVDLSKQRNWSGEDLLYVIRNFPLVYISQEEGLAVIINTTSGTNITEISLERNGDIIKTIQEFNVTPVQNGYLVSLRIAKVKYVPRPVEIRVVVISDLGRKYILRALLNIAEEGG